jgi:hypothetical protein
MLKKSLENERLKTKQLNEQIFELNQRLYENELNDSLDSPKFHKAVHIKIETKNTTTHDSNPNKNSQNANEEKVIPKETSKETEKANDVYNKVNLI